MRWLIFFIYVIGVLQDDTSTTVALSSFLDDCSDTRYGTLSSSSILPQLFGVVIDFCLGTYFLISIYPVFA
jgi:hypothetical protein